MLSCYTRTIEQLQNIAEELTENLRQVFGEAVRVTIRESRVQIGSGSLPVETLPSKAVVLESQQMSAEYLAAQFRTQPNPVIGRTQDGKLWLDVRAIGKRQLKWIIDAARTIACAV